MCEFSQIKDRKHIEQNFHFVAKVMPPVGTVGAGGVKNFSVGICDGAPSTARSSFLIEVIQVLYNNCMWCVDDKEDNRHEFEAKYQGKIYFKNERW